MDNDHLYNISSQSDEVFSSEWFTVLNDPNNILEESSANQLSSQFVDVSQVPPNGSPNTLEYFLTENQDVLQIDGSECPELLNTIMTENDQVIMEVKNEEDTIEVSNQVYSPASLPASENWPGEYDFNISFSLQEKKSKSVTWTYSESKDKLYVGKDTPCPINFSTKYPMPDGVTIRAMALYSSPESSSEVVKRCVNHAKDDETKDAYHLVRCESPMAVYKINSATKRHSVIIPFENPSVGQKFSTYIYKFACFGSCPCPGPNRRPLMLVFSLENGTQVLGRRKVDVKICACPGRDSKTDEKQTGNLNLGRESKKRKRKSEPVLDSEIMELPGSSSTNHSKKSKALPNEDGYYTLNVKDYKCFEFLTQLKKYYELIKTIKNMPPDVKTVLKQYQQRKGYNGVLEL